MNPDNDELASLMFETESHSMELERLQFEADEQRMALFGETGVITPFQKPYYRPIEAAIRFCGLHEMEHLIMGAVDPGYAMPAREDFINWPYLYNYTDKILDAIDSGELKYGRVGIPVSQGVWVPKDRLTIRHEDLKAWLEQYDPKCRPPFLFGDGDQYDEVSISRQEYENLKKELKSKSDAAVKSKNEIYTLETAAQFSTQQIADLEQDVKTLQKKIESDAITGKSETSLKNIIGALIFYIAGKVPSVKPHPSFKNESNLIDTLSNHFDGFPGLSKSNLSRKFPDSKRSLEN